MADKSQFMVKWPTEMYNEIRLYMKDVGLSGNDNTLFMTACLWTFRNCSRDQQMQAISKAAEILNIPSPVLTPDQKALLKELGKRVWGAGGISAITEEGSGKSPKKRHTA